MYCDRCGAALSPGAQVCNSCGKAVAASAAAPNATATPAAVLPASEQTRVQRHLNLLATLWIANAILRMTKVGSILIAGRILPLFAGLGFDRAFADWPFNVFGYSLYVIGAIMAVFAVAHAAFAVGLWQRQPWARPLGLVLAFISLIRIPFGTALGIYTLWVLLPAASGQEYQRLCQAYQHRSPVSA